MTRIQGPNHAKPEAATHINFAGLVKENYRLIEQLALKSFHLRMLVTHSPDAVLWKVHGWWLRSQVVRGRFGTSRRVPDCLESVTQSTQGKGSRRCLSKDRHEGNF